METIIREYIVTEQDNTTTVTDVSDIRFAITREDVPIPSNAEQDILTVEELLLEMNRKAHIHKNSNILNKLDVTNNHLTLNGQPVADLSGVYSKEETDNKIANVIGIASGALAALESLGDIATTIVEQNNKIATVEELIASKADASLIINYTGSNGIKKVGNDFQLSETPFSLPAPAANGSLLSGDVNKTFNWVSIIDQGTF